jgi:hypothetical protein
MIRANSDVRRRFPLRRVLAAAAAAIVVAALAVGLQIRAAVKSIPHLFDRSAQLKAQGYYLGEFEFKLLAVQYYLNEGSYWTAYRTLQRIRREMETTQGLVKMPHGASPAAMLAFLRDRQDPATGAFMDARYPFFTFIGPTLNVIDAMETLSAQAGQPMRLKYPLRFLDRIRSPEHLRAFIDSLLYLKERWARFGGPGPYAAVSELPSLRNLERAGLYKFSDEWSDTLRQWFNETQNPSTGCWSARIGTPRKWRQKVDLNSTFHVIKLMVDDRGGDHCAKYPLRHADALARTISRSLKQAVPAGSAEQHAWSLEQAQGVQMITRYLWNHLAEPQREEIRGTMAACLTARYGSFFRSVDGGFAFYISSAHGDVDGTANALGLIRATGSLPGTWERDRLWGKTIAAAPGSMRGEVQRWEEATLPAVTNANSSRIYKNAPPGDDAYDDANLVQIVYPAASPVLDVMDLRQNIARFTTESRQAFGNWASIEALRDTALDLRGEVRRIPVTRGPVDLARLSRDHPDAARFYAVGYDTFQIPVFAGEFARKRAPL